MAWPASLTVYSCQRYGRLSTSQRPRLGISVPDPTPVPAWRSSPPSCSPPEPGHALWRPPPVRWRSSAWRWWPALPRRGGWQLGYRLRVAAAGSPHRLWERRGAPPSPQGFRARGTKQQEKQEKKKKKNIGLLVFTPDTPPPPPPPPHRNVEQRLRDPLHL